MGGNALRNFGAKRISKERYDEVLKDLSNKLSWLDYRVIKSYRNKQSFGDIDLLIRPLSPQGIDRILSSLSSVKWINLAGTFSVLYQEVQLDFIIRTPDELESSYNYYAYNDLGNLMGKIFHKLGLTYGHRGLGVVIVSPYSKTWRLTTLLITKDLPTILRVGGFNAKEYDKFNELEDIFNFVINSKYFSPSVFSLENLNHVNRMRDRKRETYTKFLKYIEGYNPSNYYVFNKDRSMYVDGVLDEFPEVKEEYLSILDTHIQEVKAKEKIDGKIVMRITDLEGLELGNFMKYLKETWPAYKEEALTLTPEEIESKVMGLKEDWGNLRV